MKKIFGMLVVLLICGNVFSQGIEFQHVSFKEALEKAKTENKMVFMDCYTSWCGPCKALAKNVFTQKEVGAFFNENYICIKMDMEKGEGPDLLKRYEIQGFPTLLYMDATGKVLSKRVGGTDAAGLISDGKTAGDPTQRLEYVQKLYQEGDRSKEIVTKYISLLQKNYMREEMTKVGNEYLKTLSKEDLLDADNFKVLCAVGASFESEEFQYVLKNKEKFRLKVNAESVNQLIMYTYYNYLTELSKGSDIEKLKRIVAVFDKLYPDPRNKDFYGGLYEEFYVSNKQFDKWFESSEAKLKIAEAAGDKMYSQTLVRIASSIANDSRFAENSGAYDKAINWVKKAVKLNSSVERADICMAMLYQKKGDKVNALKSLNNSREKNSPLSERMEKYYNSLKAQIDKL